MVWRHLVCSRCNAPVAEGRCGSCRRAQQRDPDGTPARELALRLVCLLLLAVATMVALMTDPALSTP